MWLMTKHGFYSIVQKRPGVYHVRARERGDLINLLEALDWPEIDVVEGTSDYPYRLIVTRDIVLRILRYLGETLNYDNFKATIAHEPGQENKVGVYHRIWESLAFALGAHGLSGAAAWARGEGKWPSRHDWEGK